MHPLAGTWIANIAKSRRHANHQFHSASMRFEIDGDVVAFSYEGINAAGKHEAATQRMSADGREHPVPEAPTIVTVNTLGTDAFESVAKKDGVVMGGGVYAVSEDGETMTATLSGIDASGKPFDQVIVFDRSHDTA